MCPSLYATVDIQGEGRLQLCKPKTLPGTGIFKTLNIILFKRLMLCCPTGLERFGIKLGDAAKLFGKKFAAGASITKSATDQDQIEVQGDFLEKAAELIVKQYGKEHGIKKPAVFVIENKKREPFFDEESDED